MKTEFEILSYELQDNDDGARRSFMSDDVLGAAKSLGLKEAKHKSLKIIILPDIIDDNILKEAENKADELSKSSFVGLRIPNAEVREDLNYESYGFSNINFYCGFDNSVPYLYTKEDEGLAVVNEMKRLQEEI